MIRRFVPALAVAAVVGGALLTPAHAAPPRSGITITGAGSTFDYPFFDKAFAVYKARRHVTINYQPVGSGAGIQLFTQKTVDFGASDVPMNPTTELQAAIKAGGTVFQIPIALGGVSIAYNLPGIKSGLHMTGPVLAQIYLGTISRWNNPQIRKLNPHAHLPNLAIVPVHRSDASGTSYIFTDYLSKVSDQWRGVVGTGKLPNWPAGIGGKGNPGVAQNVQATPGAIGYVELAYVLQNHMKEALLQNRKHQWLYPTQKTVAAAAAAFPHVSAQRYSIVNAHVKNAYPIAGYSWLLLFKHPAHNAAALKTLVRWMVLDGQRYAGKLDYVPLPKNVRKVGLNEIKQVR